MTPERQRIVMAELEGWRADQWSPPNASWFLYGPDGERHSDPSCGTREAAFGMHVPDYLNDANAANRAQALVKDRWADYVTCLFSIVIVRQVYHGHNRQVYAMWMLCQASPAQKVEAILRTLGRWEP